MDHAKEKMMHHCKMTAVALGAMLSAGALCAAPEHAGKEGFSKHSEVKRSGRIERSSQSDRGTRRIAPPAQKSLQQKPYKSTRVPRTQQPAVKGSTKTRPAEKPVRKTLKPLRPSRHWVPPKHKPLPYYYRPGYTIGTIPKVAVTVTLGSLIFYYADGIYYRRHDGGFMVIVPPIGLIVPVLPVGYTVFYLHGITYYYYADVYYVWDLHHQGYRVVDVPAASDEYRPGEIVDILPDGAYTVTIDGVQYYRYGGVYFMQAIQGERIVYIVVTP
jgi:hypothetical protein